LECARLVVAFFLFLSFGTVQGNDGIGEEEMKEKKRKKENKERKR
jgi:hypothetical protein